MTERKIVMEIKTATVKADGFKVTPEWLKAIGIDLKNWPTLPQALKAKKEADIALMTDSPYYEKMVQFVLQNLRTRCLEEDVVNVMFNYGYILGIRAERARRKGVK